MEYFKKLWDLNIDQDIIDCPIFLQEVAILQDSVDKNILGRIKFVNLSRKNIIAVFFNYKVEDISGEEIPLENNQYVFQDMCVKPGEMYGNTIAIDLPDMARKLFVEINKVIFEDEEAWKASEAKKCDSFSPEEIVPPENNFERIKDELSKKINHVEYVKYYYQENESAWLCTCGKVNNLTDESCSFCDTLQTAEKELLTKENFKSFCASVDEMVEEEKKAEAEKKKAEIYAEAKRREAEREVEEQKRIQRELEEDQESHKRNVRTAVILVIVAVIVAGIIVAGILVSDTSRSGSAETTKVTTSQRNTTSGSSSSSSTSKNGSTSKSSSNSNSGSGSSKSSSSGGNSSIHYCEADGCNKIGTHQIEGLNGTPEYYCDTHYNEIKDYLDMFTGN